MHLTTFTHILIADISRVGHSDKLQSMFTWPRSNAIILSIGYKLGDKLVVGSFRGSSATHRWDLVFGRRGRIVDLKGS